MQHFEKLDAPTRAFYVSILRALAESGLPFLLGGAHAFRVYTDIDRATKDLDVLIQRHDLQKAMSVLEERGCGTRIESAHWLAKAQQGEHAVDLIFATGNGVGVVDETWFERADAIDVMGIRVALCPPEEMLFTKAFIMERERFDGADVAHLLKACADTLDWGRLLELFDEHWRVLYSHLILFGYIYPSKQQHIPNEVLSKFTERMLQQDAPSNGTDVCRGTLLSRAQYLVDIRDEEFIDARLQPFGRLSKEDVRAWTEAIKKDGPDTMVANASGTSRSGGP